MLTWRATLALYRDRKRVAESSPVRVNRLTENRQSTLPVWLQLPTASLQPGRYECQVNLIDEFGRKFAFPGTAVAVTSAPSQPITPP